MIQYHALLCIVQCESRFFAWVKVIINQTETTAAVDKVMYTCVLIEHTPEWYVMNSFSILCSMKKKH